MRECARETGKYFMAVREGENWMIPAELKTEAKTPLSWETGPKLKWLNHIIIHHLWWWQQRMKNTIYTIMSVILHYSHLQPCLKGIWVGFLVIHWWEDSPWVTENKTGLEHCTRTGHYKHGWDPKVDRRWSPSWAWLIWIQINNRT